MATTDVLVVGAGQAAAQLCLSLRAGSFRDRLVVIGTEPYAPYQRPPLSKKFLTERRPPETLLLRADALWRELGVELLLGTTVEAIDLRRRSLTAVDARAVEEAFERRLAQLGSGGLRSLAATGRAGIVRFDHSALQPRTSNRDH